MKKIFRFFILTGLVLLLLSGCLTMPDTDFSLSDKISSAMGLDEMAVQMQAMEFYALYAAYGFHGGYAYESGFAEGEGTAWIQTAEDKDGAESGSEFERIFLKDMGDGSGWWRMEVRSEGNTAKFEYLMSGDSDFLVVRFRDEESGEIVEYRPEEETDSDRTAEEESDEEVEDYEAFEGMDYSQSSMGLEKITVGAGTFTAEHRISEFKDDSNPEHTVDFRSDWWISESVPGGVVKYMWTDREDGSRMESELAELLSGQTTNLESY